MGKFDWYFCPSGGSCIMVTCGNCGSDSQHFDTNHNPFVCDTCECEFDVKVSVEFVLRKGDNIATTP